MYSPPSLLKGRGGGRTLMLLIKSVCFEFIVNLTLMKVCSSSRIKMIDQVAKYIKTYY